MHRFKRRLFLTSKLNFGHYNGIHFYIVKRSQNNAKKPKRFLEAKGIQNRPKLPNLALKKPNWQPWPGLMPFLMSPLTDLWTQTQNMVILSHMHYHSAMAALEKLCMKYGL